MRLHRIFKSNCNALTKRSAQRLLNNKRERTMSKLTNNLLNLTAAQRKALKERIQLDAQLNSSRRLIQITSREANIPLSFAQQRLWFLDQLMPGSIAYNMSGAVRLSGPLNIAALEQSLTEVLRRH